MLKRKLIVTGVLILLAGGFIVYQLVRGSPTLVIENSSGQRVTVLEVRAGEQKETFRDIKEKGEIRIMLKVKEGDELIFEGQLADEDVIRGRLRITGTKLRGFIRPKGMIDFRPADK
jgi:hypothetical protein